MRLINFILACIAKIHSMKSNNDNLMLIHSNENMQFYKDKSLNAFIHA